MSLSPHKTGNALWHELRLLGTAAQCLTRSTLPAWVGWDARWLQQCTRHFPAVGLLVGAAAAAVLWVAAHAWPALLTVLVSMATTVWLTRAVHEDDLARSVGDRYGLVCLVMVLAIKAAALHGLVTRDLLLAMAALPLAHAWSRGAIVLGLRLARSPRPPDPGESGRAQGHAAVRVDGQGFLLALLWCVLAAAVAAPFLPGRALAAAAVASLALALWLARSAAPAAPPPVAALAGHGWGVPQQVCELAVYLAVLAVLAQG